VPKYVPIFAPTSILPVKGEETVDFLDDNETIDNDFGK
jgi:hypothetical protein